MSFYALLKTDGQIEIKETAFQDIGELVDIGLLEEDLSGLAAMNMYSISFDKCNKDVFLLMLEVNDVGKADKDKVRVNKCITNVFPKCDLRGNIIFVMVDEDDQICPDLLREEDVLETLRSFVYTGDGWFSKNQGNFMYDGDDDCDSDIEDDCDSDDGDGDDCGDDCNDGDEIVYVDNTPAWDSDHGC